MISGPEIVMLHPEEYGLQEAVVAAARKVTAALDHGRDPSRASIRALHAAVWAMTTVTPAQQDEWDEIVRNS